MTPLEGLIATDRGSQEMGVAMFIGHMPRLVEGASEITF